MAVYARRFDWRSTDPLVVTALLDEFVAHPEFLAYPMEPTAARVVGADLLTNTGNLVWAAYSDQSLTGVVILTRIIPRVDALMHFMFLDRDLKSKRRLLQNILGHCFTDLGFHRISMEVPEGVRLERFARRTLGFRLEGEIRDRNPELPKCLDQVWAARQGSRREQGYFDGTAWSDIVLLRLLGGEWVDREGSQCRSEPSPEPHPLLEASSVASPAVAGPATPSPSSPKTSRDSARTISGS